MRSLAARLRSLPLQARYVAAAGVSAVVLWAAIAWMLHAAQRESLAAAAASGQTVARSLAEQETSSLRVIDLSLQQLRDQWQRDPASFAAVADRHAEYLKDEGVIQIAVVDHEGWVLYSRLPQPPRVNFADRDYFQVQRASATDRMHISTPVLGRITKQWAIQFTRPLFTPDRRFAGVVVMALPPPALERLYRDIGLGTEGRIALFRTDGALLARTGEFASFAGQRFEAIRGMRPDDPPAAEYRARSSVDGVERIVAYRRLQGYPLVVYVGQGVNELLAPYERQRWAVVSGGLLATALLFAVALLLGSRARYRAKFAEERERLMLELHDGCIQAVYAIGLSLQNVRRLMETDPKRASRAVADAGANLNLVIQDLRRFIAGRAGRTYGEGELVAEIERLIPDLGDGGPVFDVDIDRSVVAALEPWQAEHLLRIAGEGVSNIVRHAGATSASLRLHARDGKVVLEMADDGKGIAPQPSHGLGLGLHHIQARARKLRGTARIGSAPGPGTRITVEFPRAA